MNRKEFIKQIDEKVRLIRNENGYTQDKMAEMVGISKKTLVEVEKGRKSLGWTTTIAICTIFRDSEILNMITGGDAQNIILSLAFDNYENKNIINTTMGGKIWWKDIDKKDRYKIQKNIITKHYRILNDENIRICFSINESYVKKRLEELSEK